MEQARRRVAKRRPAIATLQASGAHKEAFNQAVLVLQAQMARECRRRPHEAPSLYEYLTERFLALAEQAPILVVETVAGDGR